MDEIGCRRVGFAHPAAADLQLIRLDYCRGMDLLAVGLMIFVQQLADDGAEAKQERAE